MFLDRRNLTQRGFSLKMFPLCLDVTRWPLQLNQTFCVSRASVSTNMALHYVGGIFFSGVLISALLHAKCPDGNISKSSLGKIN